MHLCIGLNERNDPFFELEKILFIKIPYHNYQLFGPHNYV